MYIYIYIHISIYIYIYICIHSSYDINTYIRLILVQDRDGEHVPPGDVKTWLE